jgi:hypothetical protein
MSGMGLRLDDETILEWMTSEPYQGFLQCESTLALASDAIVAIDLANLDAALTHIGGEW